ncbi:hypothetical protein I6I18_09080 [Kytococcus sedentarius]|uniref:Altered inheritance of mitochondria protein 6 n=1 Tax=Kytococcus sedentarius (strain ATCC 14392 / DSM 20547 / JCM 11482 / CCUG 33030 / NBRC 15357 / NCTC 11040 / CCM 314 / 541) TaxID=478801 RepID=C7NM04_KYTSD|nr:hypothetical protein [Kytococcus sedentarius]ACV07253.1 hypothetical protein Ksed_22760 [Kytococcus sedentarius DSM 20547]QQB63219.1 hypothetical protein I6I18_09080 [Kytococcus sedentarius]STX13911.1 Uncharacterised protein [Kytococcus sedentarius]
MSSVHSAFVTRRTLLAGGAFASALTLLPDVGAVAGPRAANTRATTPATGITPLWRAHAHNDYEHRRPLLDALSHGFTSVEADVWLEGDELLIGHAWPDPSRTLRELYLDPLARIAEANGGWVYPGHARPVRLLVDVKSGGAEARALLEDLLPTYGRTVTSWKNGRERSGAVTVVLSGQQANPVLDAPLRWTASDGRLGAPMPAGATAADLPLVSASWSSHFSWVGIGPMPASQRDRLHALVAEAHARGQQVRFWATPDTIWLRENVWAELLAAGVDAINTDHLAELQAWLLQHDRG